MNFKEIINSNRHNVKNIIKLFTKEENEDLEQEVYIKVLKNSEKYEERGNLKAWINTVAKNVSKDYLKSAKYQKEILPDEENDNVFINIKDSKPDPELKLIQKERQKSILKAIDELKPKLKDAIIYTEIYGYSYELAAAKLNCPTGTLKSRIFNAKKELAQKLKDLL